MTVVYPTLRIMSLTGFALLVLKPRYTGETGVPDPLPVM
jgi:hypothetical protein